MILNTNISTIFQSCIDVQKPKSRTVVCLLLSRLYGYKCLNHISCSKQQHVFFSFSSFRFNGIRARVSIISSYLRAASTEPASSSFPRRRKRWLDIAHLLFFLCFMGWPPDRSLCLDLNLVEFESHQEEALDLCLKINSFFNRGIHFFSLLPYHPCHTGLLSNYTLCKWFAWVIRFMQFSFALKSG